MAHAVRSRAALPTRVAGTPGAFTRARVGPGGCGHRAHRNASGRQSAEQPQSGTIPGRSAGAAAQERTDRRLAERGRRVLSEDRSGAGRSPLSGRCSPSPGRPDLWQRHRGAAREVVEPVQRCRVACRAESGGDERNRAVSPGVARRARAWPQPAGAPGRRHRVGGAGVARCLAHRIARSAACAVRWGSSCVGDRSELRPPARISRRSDARALHPDPEGRGEPAGVRRVCAQPADCPTGRRTSLLRRRPARLRPRRAAHGKRDTVRQQHVRGMGRGAGDQTRAAAHPGDPLRRARQVEALQQPAALLATARVRPDPADRGSPRLVHRRRAVVVLRLAERGKEPGLPEQDALSVPGGGRRRDAGAPLGRAGRNRSGAWHRRASRTSARRWRSGWACPDRSSRGGPLVLWLLEVVSR